jgi:DNA repair protein RecN (Recombination protein N)
MLSELRITDFAIIDTLALRFEDGLVTFTGETGAGKSIIIDAVEAVLGGRVEAGMIRAGVDRAVIEADFKISENVRGPVREILIREALMEEDDYVTLAREIRAEGRHIARVNGSNVKVGLLREIGEYLVDVHGQSEHLSLLRVREHLRLLDSYAGAEAELSAYRAPYNRLSLVRKELDELRQAETDAARRVDLLTYQIDEIDAAALQTGEEDDLKQERSRLSNSESLSRLTLAAVFALDESDPESESGIDLLGKAVQALKQVSEMDESQKEIAARAEELHENLSDLTVDLRDYVDSIEFDEKRLDEVEDRIDLIQDLKRKYGNSIPEILAYLTQANEELEAISIAEERIEALEKEERQLLGEIREKGQALYARRQQASTDLSRALEAQLMDLRMAGAQFDVEFIRRPDPENGLEIAEGEKIAFGPTGLETIQFLVAPNPGEGLKPLAKIASGGEMSRLMLALKNVLAQADLTPTLIFDEIDQGIGGRVGAVVGEKLSNLSGRHQVLCITHLPQLAAYGRQHYKVTKHVDQGRTSTLVRPLNGDDRIAELAQMLGDISPATLESAREMLAAVRIQFS